MTSVSTARRNLKKAQAAYAAADAHAASLPTEGFNADKAMTPALESRGRAQRALWRAEEALDSAKLAARGAALSGSEIRSRLASAHA